jgi:hypothetical protein
MRAVMFIGYAVIGGTAALALMAFVVWDWRLGFRRAAFGGSPKLHCTNFSQRMRVRVDISVAGESIGGDGKYSRIARALRHGATPHRA